MRNSSIMSKEPFLLAAEETTADDDCTVGSSEHTEDETDKDENANLKECENANSVEKNDAECQAHLETSRKRKRQTCDKSGNVLKISSSLFSKRKTKKSAGQKSKAFSSSSAETIELQAHKLCNGTKNGVDNVSDEFPKSTLPKKSKRIYKPRPRKLCEICDKFFADSSSFAKHKRVHLKEKPFKCDQCHKSFRQSNDLKRHIRIHDNNQAFPCKLCSSSFSCPDNLKRHKVVHAQEKPFQCRHCSSSFTRLTELKTHTKIHTEKDLFKCQLCDMTFSRASSVKRHMSTHFVKDESSS